MLTNMSTAALMPRTAPRAVSWHTDLLGNSLSAWAWAVAVSIGCFIVVRLVIAGIRRTIAPLAERRDSTPLHCIASALGVVRSWLLLVIALAIGIRTLTFGGEADYWLRLIAYVLVGIQLVLCLTRAVRVLLTRILKPERPMPVMVMFLIIACEAAIWITFILAILGGVGINITAFVASLGVGGIAIALALQNILSDLFASVAIGVDKPFEPGEFIMFGSELGTVKKVGIKSTRIDSLAGEELSIGNSQLLSQLTHNFSRMPERRVVFGFTVPFSTGKEELREISDRVNGIIRSAEQVRFDRGHFTGFGENGFDFEFVYYMLDSGFALYRDTQQEINHQIMDVLGSLDVPFAVPARAVALPQRPAESTAS